MKLYTLIFLSFFSLTVLAQNPLNKQEIKSFKNRVEQQAEDIKTIQTGFEQEKHLSFLSNDIQSEGKMVLNEDGNLKWAYTAPKKYSIIFKENRIYINDDGNKKSVDANSAVFKNISQLISGSMRGNLFDDDQFEISYFKDEGEIIAELIPKDKALKKYIEEVNLFFPKTDGMVAKVKLIEPSGDYTKITFKNRKLNVKIDPDIFKQ